MINQEQIPYIQVLYNFKEQTEKARQKSELRKMKTEQKKVEQSKQSALIFFIKKKE